MFWFKKNKTVNTDKFNAFTSTEAGIMSPTVLVEKEPDTLGDYRVELGNNINGCKHIRTWYAKLTGRTTWIGMFDRLLLAHGDAEIDFTISVEPIDVSVEQERIGKRISELGVEISDTTNKALIGKLAQEQADLEEQLSRLRTNEEMLYDTSFFLSIGTDRFDALQKISRLIIKSMQSIGMIFRATDTRQLNAFRHAIGIGPRSEFNDTYKPMESSNVSDTFLFGYGGLSHRKGILLGLDHYNRPVFYDNWHPPLANANGLIFGRSGAGKSFAFKIITRRTWSLGVPTAIVDLHREYWGLIDSMDGIYIELNPEVENHHRINLYEVREETNRNGKGVVKLEDSYKAILPFLYKIVTLLDANELTGQVKVSFYETLQKLYKQFGINSDPDSLYEYDSNQSKKYKRMPTLYDHYLLMKQEPRLEGVIDFIKMFTRESEDRARSIFDGESTFDLAEFRPMAICLEGLDKEMMQPLGMFVSMKWLTENFVKRNRLPKRLFVDEAQKMLENEEDAIGLENVFREIRKLNGGIWIATQGFEVLLRVPQGMGILKNSPTKLLLRQESIDIDAVIGKFNLSEGEAMRLLNAPKGVGILKVDEESTIVRLQATADEFFRYRTDGENWEHTS
ncbi:DUF87 domain-containing protein (plasmid) [Brevibacillus laterosporus]|uniref:VirB4 family type IV secretion system protein n=1 Tax=Brevibacillus laterosporus TaxID=1465 RepID=UPI000E6B76AE|nr:DUF87 domain-containing protein [Brevibacillus laterosporus]AYB41727.1 DUF87 domain-containing protein [Brevibacillus laterosporus]MBG9804918.1 hypothetical protein [Brevibacillus laterosporus]MED1790567.1 DUF87 domain-containing protein [Brevibacillus laterosporus]MED4762072.1 DUF87 domain-containing protein [Brevibacillus laterosporus]TPH09934.1 DUF87 domain-containing protein [Brevibacillus laterosporus]